MVNKYDVEGLRSSVVENDVESSFLFSGRDVIAEFGDDNLIKNRILRSGVEILSQKKDDSNYFYVADEHNDVRFVFDCENYKLNNYDYDVFGNLIDSSESISNRFRYNGEQFDVSTQQYYLRARFYNPSIARFTQEDVFRDDGLNLYSFVQNNPIRYYDPSGYLCETKVNAHNEKVKNWNPEEHGGLSRGEYLRRKFNPQYQIDKLSNIQNFGPNALKHIFEGELPHGSFQGYHYEGVPTALDGIRVGTDGRVDKYGSYKGVVWYDGRSKPGKNSFFSKNFTPQQIVNYINEAYVNMRLITTGYAPSYEGVASNGMTIKIILEKGSTKIKTAFPIYNK